MARRLIVIVALLSLLAGCARLAESRLNPFNWFGRSQEVETFVPVARAPDPRPLVDQVTELTIERTPGGAIVRARGLPATQGYWGGDLVAENRGVPVEGVLTYMFRIVPPETGARSSSVRSREIVVGQFLTQQDMDGVREIRVVAARNSRAVRR